MGLINLVVLESHLFKVMMRSVMTELLAIDGVTKITISK